MTEVLPFLDDPLVHRMADLNHVPQEMWSSTGTLLSVSCEVCHHSWPCPTRGELEELRRRPRPNPFKVTE